MSCRCLLDRIEPLGPLLAQSCHSVFCLQRPLPLHYRSRRSCAARQEWTQPDRSRKSTTGGSGSTAGLEL